MYHIVIFYNGGGAERRAAIEVIEFDQYSTADRAYKALLQGLPTGAHVSKTW